MKWAYRIDLQVDNINSLKKLDGIWNHHERFQEAIGELGEVGCASNVHGKLLKPVTILSTRQIPYTKEYINLIAWVAHVGLEDVRYEVAHGIAGVQSCRCRHSPVHILTNSHEGRVYLSSVNLHQPPVPSKLEQVWVHFISQLAVINLFCAYLMVYLLLLFVVPIYGKVQNDPKYGPIYVGLNKGHTGRYLSNGSLVPGGIEPPNPAIKEYVVTMTLTGIACLMALVGIVMVELPAFYPNFFRHYSNNHHFWRWTVQILSKSFRFDMVYVSLLCITFGVSLGIGSGLHIIPPDNSGFLGWTSTLSYTAALFVCGAICAIFQCIQSGSRA
jgi:hypothetical protein